MNTANAVYGSSGNRLISGFDVSNGIGIDLGYYENEILFNRKPQKNEWIRRFLIDLKNFSGNMDLLVNYILNDNKEFKANTPCEYSKNGSVSYVRIGKYEYRLKGYKIHKKEF